VVNSPFIPFSLIIGFIEGEQTSKLHTWIKIRRDGSLILNNQRKHTNELSLKEKGIRKWDKLLRF